MRKIFTLINNLTNKFFNKKKQMKIQVNDSETPRLIEYQAQNYYKEYYRQYDFNSSSSGQIAYV